MSCFCSCQGFLLQKEQSSAIFSAKLYFCFTFADDFLDISWRNVSEVSSWGSGIRMLFDIVDMSVSLEGFSQDIAARVPRWHGGAPLAYREFKSSKNAAFLKQWNMWLMTLEEVGISKLKLQPIFSNHGVFLLRLVCALLCPGKNTSIYFANLQITRANNS